MKPEHKMKVEKGITVTMRDGVKISLCVYRPDGPGPFPTLFAASPYQYEMDEVPAYPLFLWRETGPVEWYVGQGYAYVHADVRGSGRSEGEFSFMGKPEQEDYLELIARIVKQPWCNGRIGGIYYADDFLAEPMQFVDGGILVPTAPGMGIAVNEAKVERYKIKA